MNEVPGGGYDDAEITAKVQGLTIEQREARLYALADAEDRSLPVLLEMAKLLFGLEATVGQDFSDSRTYYNDSDEPNLEGAPPFAS